MIVDCIMSFNELKGGRQFNREHPALLSLFEMSLIAHQADTYLGSVLPHGATTSQFLTLQVLGDLESPPTISYLAEQMGVTQPTMSWTLHKLEKQGWVDLCAASEDRRAKTVRMTQEGLSIKAQCESEALPHLEKLIASLPEESWSTLHPHLRKLRQNLPERS